MEENKPQGNAGKILRPAHVSSDTQGHGKMDLENLILLENSLRFGGLRNPRNAYGVFVGKPRPRGQALRLGARWRFPEDRVQ